LGECIQLRKIYETEPLAWTLLVCFGNYETEPIAAGWSFTAKLRNRTNYRLGWPFGLITKQSQLPSRGATRRKNGTEPITARLALWSIYETEPKYRAAELHGETQNKTKYCPAGLMA
jgi:hypothetical protein